MATIQIIGILDPDVLVGKDRHAKQVVDAIVATAEKEGDKEATAEVLCGQVFFTSHSSKVVTAVKGLFEGVAEMEVIDLSDLAAISIKSRLSHEAKRKVKAEATAKQTQ